MDELLYAIIVALAVALIGVLIKWTKLKGYDDKAEAVYIKYELFFSIVGSLLQSIDADLYKELDEAITAVRESYEKDDFTKEDLERCIRECDDVVARVKALLEERKSQIAESKAE